MGRYLKYLEIVNKIDAALEKMVSGKVDINKDLPKLKTMLEVQEKALCMSQKIDHIDDAVKSTAKLFAMGDPSAQEVVEAVSHLLKKQKEGGGQQQEPQQMQEQAYGGSAQGRDFRDRREDSRSEARGSYSAGNRAEARGAYAYGMEEEDRRGVKGTGRYSRYRRSRSEMDEGNSYDMDDEEYFVEEDRRGVPGSGRSRSELEEMEEDRRRRSRRTGRFVRGEMEQGNWYPLPFIPIGRMGYTGDVGEMNGPYNGVQIPVQNNNGGGNASSRGAIQGVPAAKTSNNAGSSAQGG